MLPREIERRYTATEVAQRILRRVEPREVVPELGPCWIWNGAKNICGYGQVRLAGRVWFTHRVVAMLWLGMDQASGLQALHRCDVRDCCNPSHLFLGTNADNVADKMSKGRHRCGSLRGEAHGMAKLTEMQVRQIFRLRQDGLSQTAIAAGVGVSQRQVSRILRGEKWRHIWSEYQGQRQQAA